MNERPNGRPAPRGNLVVTRRSGHSVMIGDEIEVTVVRVEGDKVRLGVSAPASVKVLRRELWERQR